LVLTERNKDAPHTCTSEQASTCTLATSSLHANKAPMHGRLRRRSETRLCPCSGCGALQSASWESMPDAAVAAFISLRDGRTGSSFKSTSPLLLFLHTTRSPCQLSWPKKKKKIEKVYVCPLPYNTTAVDYCFSETLQQVQHSAPKQTSKRMSHIQSLICKQLTRRV
jgi:hypothetical protein